MNDDDLRAMGPPGLSTQRHVALRSQLLMEITEAADDEMAAPTVRRAEPPMSPPPASTPTGGRASGGTGRRWIAAAAAVALVAGVAIAVALVGDDATDEVAAPGTAPTAVGADPRLDGAPITCVGAEGAAGTYAATATLPPDGLLSGDDLVTACREQGPERGGARPSAAAVCSAPGTEPPELVVILRPGTCEDADLVPVTAGVLDRWQELLDPGGPGS